MEKASDLPFQDLLSLIEGGSVIQLFDVREPNELEESGRIPSAINVPLAEFKGALQLTCDQFKEKYGVKKPSPDDDNFIIYCRSGRRSTMAQDDAIQLGYHKLRNYKGSFLDWMENKGPIDK